MLLNYLTPRTIMRRFATRALFLCGAVLLAAAIWITIVDFQVNKAIQTLPSKIANSVVTGEVAALQRLARGETINEGDLADAIAFIKGQNDGSDFRLITLLRALYAYGHALPFEAANAIKEMLLGFRYWMGEPGASPMFHASENHQILFAAAEFLAGQLFPVAAPPRDRRRAIRSFLICCANFR
jgi:hypothetical protein